MFISNPLKTETADYEARLDRLRRHNWQEEVNAKKSFMTSTLQQRNKFAAFVAFGLIYKEGKYIYVHDAIPATLLPKCILFMDIKPFQSYVPLNGINEMCQESSLFYDNKGWSSYNERCGGPDRASSSVNFNKLADIGLKDTSKFIDLDEIIDYLANSNFNEIERKKLSNLINLCFRYTKPCQN
jgi:hypothetical protein